MLFSPRRVVASFTDAHGDFSVIGVTDIYGNGLADGALDRFELSAFAGVAKGKGNVLRTGARVAADTVYITFRFRGQFKIDDMGYIVDVNASRGDVGGHEHTDLARRACREALLPGALGFEAVDGVRRDAGFLQLFVQSVAANANPSQRTPIR